MSESQLVDIEGLSKALGREAFPVRTIRTLKDARKIPFLKLGHKKLVFDIPKVRKALEKFEVKAVASPPIHGKAHNEKRC